MVKLLVCAKQVADLENMLPGEWQLSEDGKSIPTTCVGRIMNPYDANALELALRLKESLPEGEARLTVLTAGSESSLKILQIARAVGADRCIRIQWPDGADYVSEQMASLLCAAIRQLGGFDLIFFGASAGDFDMGLTGLLCAARLDLPMFQEVLDLKSLEGCSVRIRHLLNGGVAERVVSVPCAVTVGTPPEVCLRSPTLKAVLAACRETGEIMKPEEPLPNPTKVLEKLSIPSGETNCIFWDPKHPDTPTKVWRLLETGGDRV